MREWLWLYDDPQKTVLRYRKRSQRAHPGKGFFFFLWALFYYAPKLRTICFCLLPSIKPVLCFTFTTGTAGSVSGMSEVNENAHELLAPRATVFTNFSAMLLLPHFRPGRIIPGVVDEKSITIIIRRHDLDSPGSSPIRRHFTVRASSPPRNCCFVYGMGLT